MEEAHRDLQPELVFGRQEEGLQGEESALVALGREAQTLDPDLGLG